MVENKSLCNYFEDKVLFFNKLFPLNFFDYYKKHFFSCYLVLNEFIKTINLIGDKFAKHLKCDVHIKQNILNYKSLAHFGQNFILESLKGLNIVNLPIGPNLNFHNTSKPEICFAMAYKTIHSHHKSAIQSFVTKNGEQFGFGKLSCDIYCSICQTSFFIEVIHCPNCNIIIYLNLRDRGNFSADFIKRQNVIQIMIQN